MKDERKTRKQLIEELEASRGEVTDLREKLEDQNREVTIQNALGRVRARALGMQSSAELSEVGVTLWGGVRH